MAFELEGEQEGGHTKTCAKTVLGGQEQTLTIRGESPRPVIRAFRGGSQKVSQGHHPKFEADLGYRRPYLKNISEIKQSKRKGEKLKRKGREIGSEIGGVELGVMSDGQVGPRARMGLLTQMGRQMDRTCRVTAEVSVLLLVGGPLTTE